MLNKATNLKKGEIKMWKLVVYDKNGRRVREVLFLKGEELEMFDYRDRYKRQGYGTSVWQMQPTMNG